MESSSTNNLTDNTNNTSTTTQQQVVEAPVHTATVDQQTLLESLSDEQKKAIQSIIDEQVKERVEAELKQNKGIPSTTKPVTGTTRPVANKGLSSSRNEGSKIGGASNKPLTVATSANGGETKTVGGTSGIPKITSTKPSTATNPPSTTSSTNNKEEEEKKSSSTTAAAQQAEKKKQLIEEAKAKREQNERKIKEEADKRKEELEKKRAEEMERKKEEDKKRKEEAEKKKVEETEKKRLEAEKKREELERKKQEEAEKKLKIQQEKEATKAKQAAQQQQKAKPQQSTNNDGSEDSGAPAEKKTVPKTPVTGAKPKEEIKAGDQKTKKPTEDLQDDPIAKSLKQREAAGGLSATVGGVDKKIRPQTGKVTSTNKPGDNTSTTEEIKKVGATVVGVTSTRPTTAVKPAHKDEEKKVVQPPKTPSGASSTKKPTLAAKDDDISNDPIAQAMQQRIKAGGPTAVVGEAKKPQVATKPGEKSKDSTPVSTLKQPTPKKTEDTKPSVGGAKKPEEEKKTTTPAAHAKDSTSKTTTKQITLDKPHVATMTAKVPVKKEEPKKVPEEPKKVAATPLTGNSSVPKTLKGKKKNDEVTPAETSITHEEQPQVEESASTDIKPADSTHAVTEEAQKIQEAPVTEESVSEPIISQSEPEELVHEESKQEASIEEPLPEHTVAPVEESSIDNKQQPLTQSEPAVVEAEIHGNQEVLAEQHEETAVQEHSQEPEAVEVHQELQAEESKVTEVEPSAVEVIIAPVEEDENTPSFHHEQDEEQAESISPKEGQLLTRKSFVIEEPEEAPLITTATEPETVPLATAEEEAHERLESSIEEVQESKEDPNNASADEEEVVAEGNLKDELAEIDNEDNGNYVDQHQEEDQEELTESGFNNGKSEDEASVDEQTQEEPEKEEKVEEVVPASNEEQKVEPETIQQITENGHSQTSFTASIDIDFEQLRKEALQIKAYLNLADFTVPDGHHIDSAFLKDLRDRVTNEVINNEELIESLRSGNPDAEKSLQNLQETFKVSKTTKTTCIEFLQEFDVEITGWISEAQESDRVKKILRVWFVLFRPYNQEAWCAFPEILDEDTFFPDAKISLLNDAMMLGPFLNKCLDNLDLSEENLFRLGLLLKALFEDPQDELNPNSEEESDNPAEVNMAFFMYIIKDILEHTGFISDQGGKNAQKTVGREIKMALAKFDLLTQKAEYLNKIQGIMDQ